MSRLTNTAREQIRKKAIAAAFKERWEALGGSEHAPGMEAYAGACRKLNVSPLGIAETRGSHGTTADDSTQTTGMSRSR